MPELAKLPDRLIHEPSSAAPEDLALAGVRLGKNYPMPIVDHGRARQAALAAYQSIRR